MCQNVSSHVSAWKKTSHSWSMTIALPRQSLFWPWVMWEDPNSALLLSLITDAHLVQGQIPHKLSQFSIAFIMKIIAFSLVRESSTSLCRYDMYYDSLIRNAYRVTQHYILFVIFIYCVVYLVLTLGLGFYRSTINECGQTIQNIDANGLFLYFCFQFLVVNTSKASHIHVLTWILFSHPYTFCESFLIWYCCYYIWFVVLNQNILNTANNAL